MSSEDTASDASIEDTTYGPIGRSCYENVTGIINSLGTIIFNEEIEDDINGDNEAKNILHTAREYRDDLEAMGVNTISRGQVMEFRNTLMNDIYERYATVVDDLGLNLENYHTLSPFILRYIL